MAQSNQTKQPITRQGNYQNKWVRAAIPALLIHCSIGTVYCWSLVSGAIADDIGRPKSDVEWAFSLAIFFLGVSAAFLGGVVEKNIHKSSLISMVCFCSGMALTGYFIYQKSLIGIFISYGVIMGVGLGTGYLTPVKTLMLWFKENKGLGTGLAITGFGLAKVIASPVMEYLLATVGVVNMFYCLAAVYFVFMLLGHRLLQKPLDWAEPPAKQAGGAATMFTNKTFIGIWLMFFLNIHCGLALISQEKSIVQAIGLAGAVGFISSLTAAFNAAGRFGLSAWADHLKDRNTIYKLIFIGSIAFAGLIVLTNGVTRQYVLLVVLLLLVVNAGYGGGFSNVPALLSDHFGMGAISRIHGLVLSAWAVAGLTGNQMAAYIVNHTGQFINDGAGHMINPQGYQNVLLAVCVLFVAALIISAVMVKPAAKRPGN